MRYRLTESKLRGMIREAIKDVLNEDFSANNKLCDPNEVSELVSTDGQRKGFNFNTQENQYYYNDRNTNSTVSTGVGFSKSPGTGKVSQQDLNNVADKLRQWLTSHNKYQNNVMQQPQQQQQTSGYSFGQGSELSTPSENL